MEYYIFLWDMVNSTRAVRSNEKQTLAFLNKIANFCLESVSELPTVQVTSIGDGQHILFPVNTDLNHIVTPFAESVSRYASSLAAEFPDFQIRSILTKGQLYDTPLGLNGASLWRANTAMEKLHAGEFAALVK